MKFTILILIFLICASVAAHEVTPQFFLEACQRLEKKPNDAEALIVRGHYYYNTGLYHEAETDLIQASSLTTLDILARLCLASTYARLHKSKEALDLYSNLLTPENEKQLADNTDFIKGHWDRALLYEKQNLYAEAWKDIEKVLSSPPADWRWTILLHSAEVAEKMQKNDRAVELYTKALTEFPSPACESWLGKLLALLLQKKSFQEAQKILETFARALPHDPMPCFYQAMIARHYLKDEQATQLFLGQSLARAENMVHSQAHLQVVSLFWKSRIHLEQEKSREALQFINEALRQEPDHANFYLLRSWIHKKLGNAGEAGEDEENYELMRKVVGEDWIKLSLIALPGGSKPEKKKTLKKSAEITLPEQKQN